MTPDFTAQGVSSAGHAEAGRLVNLSTPAAMLVERSRRRTVIGVLDRLNVHGGEFAERRADGSAWSAKVPSHREAPQ